MTKQTHSPEATRRRTLNAVERATPPSARRVLHAFLSWLEGVRLVSASTAYLHIMLVSRRSLPELLGAERACVRVIRRLAPVDVERSLERLRELKLHARRQFDQFANRNGFVEFDLVGGCHHHLAPGMAGRCDKCCLSHQVKGVAAEQCAVMVRQIWKHHFYEARFLARPSNGGRDVSGKLHMVATNALR